MSIAARQQKEAYRLGEKDAELNRQMQTRAFDYIDLQIWYEKGFKEKRKELEL